MTEWFWSVVEALTTSAVVSSITVIIAAIIAIRLLARILRMMLVRLARYTRNGWDDRLAAALAGPLSVLIAIWAFTLSLPWLPIEPHVATILHDAVGLLSVVAVIWAAFRGIDLANAALDQRSWAVQRPASRSLVRLGARFAKVTTLVFGLLVALAQFGISVASLIAGLGIGGLVLALAAQKTVENLFGTVSIGIDQPMREGDFVRIGDCVGTVEQIGLRSTRIRTLDRTLVTIPNGELANQRVESFTARDRIRLACTIGLVYETTTRQMRTIIAALEAILRAHPKIWNDNVVVRFAQFSDSSLDIEIMAWFETRDWSEFQGVRQDILIAFMEAIENAGSSIAFPTRTLHVVDQASAHQAPPRRASQGNSPG